MNRYPTIFVLFSCVLALCACDGQGAGAQQNGNADSKAAPPPPEAGYIVARPRRIATARELPGRVSAHRTAEIRPQVSGIILSRLFEEGSFVEKGQQLYQIDPARYEADYQRAKANLQNARAELKNASSLAARYRKLIDEEAVSAQEYDDARADVDMAEAAVALAEADVRTAKINLDYTKVYAPIRGYIGPSSVTEGALVTAQQETALATIRQLDPVYVDLSQSAAEAQRIQERIVVDRMSGDRESRYTVSLLIGSSGKTYPHAGTLDVTDLVVDPRTGTIRLRSVFPNPQGVLLPGLFVRASLELAEDTEAIVVPQKSVAIQPGGTTSVWVIGENDLVEKREVKTGAAYRNNWVILDGLRAGDRVVVEGTMNLREGAAVSPAELDASKAAGAEGASSASLDDRMADDGGRKVEESGSTGRKAEASPDPAKKTAAPPEGGSE